MTALTAESSLQRRFSVHGEEAQPSRGFMVEGVSFEDAALHYVEDRHLDAGENDEVTLYVEDCETGERQCFRIDLASGDTAPCD